MDDPQLQRIKEKLQQLKELDTGCKIFGADEHQYRLSLPKTEAELTAFEAQHQLRLPEEYRLYLTEIGNGGAGPFYGLFSLEDGVKEAKNYATPDPLAQTFPYTNRATQEFLDYYKALEEEGDDDEIKFLSVPASIPGILPLAYYGHDWYYFLVVNGEQAGKVWMVGDYLSPCIFANAQVGFFDWFEQWLDQSLQELQPSSAGPRPFSKDQKILNYDGHKLADVPKEAFECSDLKKLVFSRNELKVFPKEILQFSKLRTLDLSMNPLTDLPPEIAGLKALKKLRLNYNHLLTLPDTLDQLQLEELSMYYSYDLQEIPQVVGSIDSLKRLYLSDCSKLNKLPDTLGNLRNLEVLQLNNCDKLEELPASLVALSSLRSLHLGDTKLKKLPDHFERLHNLEFLGLDIDELDLTDALEKIKKLPKLTYLKLSLRFAYPESLAELSNLKTLAIADNYALWHQGHKTLPVPEQVTLIPHLEVLNLENSNQARSLPETIGRLAELRELCIGSTSIKEFPVSLQQLTRIEKIQGLLEDTPKSLYGIRPEEKEKITRWFPKAEIEIW